MNLCVCLNRRKNSCWWPILLAVFLDRAAADGFHAGVCLVEADQPKGKSTEELVFSAMTTKTAFTGINERVVTSLAVVGRSSFFLSLNQNVAHLRNF